MTKSPATPNTNSGNTGVVGATAGIATADIDKAAAAIAAKKAERAAKFEELANARVSSALDKIAVIGKLANRSAYEWSEEQIAVIRSALIAEIDRTLARFSPEKKATASFDIRARMVTSASGGQITADADASTADADALKVDVTG